MECMGIRWVDNHHIYLKTNSQLLLYQTQIRFLNYIIICDKKKSLVWQQTAIIRRSVTGAKHFLTSSQICWEYGEVCWICGRIIINGITVRNLTPQIKNWHRNNLSSYRTKQNCPHDQAWFASLSWHAHPFTPTHIQLTPHMWHHKIF